MRSSGKEEEIEVRTRGRKGKGAPDCVGSHMCAHGSGLCACEAYGRPVVGEVRGATEDESIFCGLLAKGFEESKRLAMGESVK